MLMLLAPPPCVLVYPVRSGISQLYRSPDTTHLVANLKEQNRELRVARDSLADELMALNRLGSGLRSGCGFGVELGEGRRDRRGDGVAAGIGKRLHVQRAGQWRTWALVRAELLHCCCAMRLCV